MKKSFLFVMPGAVPIANFRVSQLLAETFPDLECEVLDYSKVLRSRPMTLVNICVRTVFEAGPGVLKSRETLRNSILRSVATEAWIKKWVANRVSAGNAAFTFQMQSLFDAGVPGCPHFVFTDHTRLENLNYPESEEVPRPPQKLIDRETEIYADARVVFVRSENIRRSLTEQYHIDPQKVEVVYAGSNLPGARSNQGPAFDRDPFTILFVGLDWDRKGGPELLMAFRRLQETHPQARLVIAGASPEIPADLPGVEVIGEVFINRLEQLYQRAGIFCLPTRREPFGIVFLEAMEHGLPVVGTDIGAQVDFIRNGETGFRVPVRDPEALAAALRRLCDDPEAAREMGRRGERLIRERYNWKSVVTRMTATIRSVLKDQAEGAAGE
ncbi:MAG: glycosyltransferase family 4 protein [Tabrizicola sp.]|uniref:glycosyltransferase family 4 protein n=1 Tax=Tabrizicola sp. TaxID=2005166 RepID=UPI00273504AB|nr:glycosyltransferase family 4 protein [Tabrizicola sp.]MDP3265069.1 glycosyltransferase family 4 protein [Tabrizicola sp.]MDP3647388.1 glycosyltransferase family 4 protein [Paracoccaceae bacterium]MDZ4066102.1 glycosyltransferase family 4 protein [Tabrizicola sp.]